MDWRAEHKRLLMAIESEQGYATNAPNTSLTSVYVLRKEIERARELQELPPRA